MHNSKADPLVSALEHFAAALDRPAEGDVANWRASLRETLDQLDFALEGHDRLADAPDGLLAPLNRPIHSNQPTLDHDMGRMRDTRQGFRDRIQKLRSQLDSRSRDHAGDVHAIHQDGLQLAGSLRDYLETETLLVQDTVNTDIGCLD